MHAKKIQSMLVLFREKEIFLMNLFFPWIKHEIFPTNTDYDLIIKSNWQEYPVV